MSLPSQQRRGAASGRASTRGIKKRRRRQGVPGPLKAAAAVMLLAVVLWTGWTVLGPQSSLADGGDKLALQQTSGAKPATEQADSPAAGYDPSNDAALNAVLGSSAKAVEKEPSLLTRASQAPGSRGNDPVRTTALPEPEVIHSNPSLVQGDPTPPRETVAAQNQAAQNRAATPDAGLSPSSATSTATSGAAGASRAMLDADVLSSQGRLVEARTTLNRALLAGTTTETERAQIRERMNAVNAVLVFGPKADPADPMTEMYKIASGDTLARIASRRELATHYKLIARVNGISDPSKIRLGQSLKLVRGPFHAVVDKSDFRIDIYQGAPNSPTSWVYITSFPIGLGEADGTPIGSFVISSNKLENPGWVNPRDSRERYDRNDPKNPIGEYWLGLDGLGASAAHVGFGLHGTTEPESIGRSMSMGCVRLHNDDIAAVFELLEERVSVVHIVD
ncbi:MAG: lipoprotein-anchoring transpeptidase ErfK/SrfK [Phycisphaerales bacterium]|jgi:lipoprotein-anchoring transpeptidase ErfK/SrfK